MQPEGWTWSPYLEPIQLLMSYMLAFTNPQQPSYCATLFPGEIWKARDANITGAIP